MSVQGYTDKFNRLAHFASDVVYDDRQRVKFYKKGLSAKLQHEVRDETTFAKMYSRALGSEFDFDAIRREDMVVEQRVAKWAFHPTDLDENSQEKGKQVRYSEDRQVDQGKKNDFCQKCKKLYHPGKFCDGTPRRCFTCNGVGHFARDCPKKEVPNPVAQKPKGKVYVMSRADAKAHPEIITGKSRVSDVPVILFLVTPPFVMIPFIFKFRGRNFCKWGGL
jgi:hypothetical protein